MHVGDHTTQRRGSSASDRDASAHHEPDPLEAGLHPFGGTDRPRCTCPSVLMRLPRLRDVGG